MEEYTGIIKEYSWHPMQVIDSILHIGVRIPSFNFLIWMKDEGSDEQLSQKYEFKILDEGWDLSDLLDRKCLIAKDDRGFRFVRYLDK